MIDRQHVETLLRIQGVTPTSPDEEIRSVLMSAKFKDDEIDTAITVLRENVTDKTFKVDGLHKIFRSEEGLKSQEISSLLGIDINVDELEINNSHRRNLGTSQYITIAVLSIIVAAICVVFVMYQNQMGPFHPPILN